MKQLTIIGTIAALLFVAAYSKIVAPRLAALTVAVASIEVDR